MVRLYGEKPFKIVLVHGGPGAIGSLKTCAVKLNALSGAGVVEALQSKYSIDGLIEELRSQITENCVGKVSLAGHSWGAWLCILLAAKYPDLCERIILIGCPPLTDEYAAEINLRRSAALSEDDKIIYRKLLNNSASCEDMKKISAILDKADNYCLLRDARDTEEKTDEVMYNRVWSEASELRAAGKLRKAVERIKCGIVLIHGNKDPHPLNGVIAPLREVGVKFDCYVLDRCGHSPFSERYAQDKFYKILSETLSR